MGFYGNITNTSKTNFVFDKIYSNRYTMDNRANDDGIFIGRYVLVEYGVQTADSFIRAYYNSNDGRFYTSSSFEALTRIKYTSDMSAITDTNITDNMVIYTLNDNTNEYKYYECKGPLVSGSTEPKLEEVNVGIDPYFYNKSQDAKYQNSRGYDGTVWVKTTVVEKDNRGNDKTVIKYVNIADLNSVVPTFDITHDAPTPYPIAPHFDTGSNNLYYQLHMQPQWGFRIKKATADTEHSDGATYPSDLQVDYSGQPIYDPTTNSYVDNNEINYPGAVYFNREGFNVERSCDTGSFDNLEINNMISIMPTGLSGNEYNDHESLYSKDTAIDTQELIIQLPAIGDTISKVWDIVYGNGERKRDINWQYITNIANNSLTNTIDGGKTQEPTEIAGCINIIHNLIGQIVVDAVINPSATNVSGTSYSRDFIYRDSNDPKTAKYYRLVSKYTYTNYNSETIPENYNQQLYVISSADNTYTKGALWNMEAKTIPSTVTLGTRVETNVWEELPTMGKHLNTILGWILEINKIFSNDKDDYTRDNSTIKGAINQLNDIVAKFDKLIPGEFVIVDEYGRVHSASYTTTQDFSAKNYGKSLNGTVVGTEDDVEDCWVSVEIDTDYSNPSITIEHKINPITDTTTTSNKNIPVTSNGGINNDTDDSLQLYTPIVDNTGHIVGKNIETVTLPYGYKTIKVTNTDNTTVSEANTVIKTDGQSADNTQDVLTLSASNRWIKLDNNSEDQIKIGHKRSDFVTGTSANTYYGLTQNEDHTKSTNSKGDLDKDNTFEVPCLKFDEAGHILEARTHTVTLPELFTTVTIGAANTGTDDTTHTAGTLEADKMTDGFTINPGNKWIQMTADSSNDKFSIQHYVKEFEQSTDAINYNNVTTKTFDIQAIDWDEAGHLISSEKTTYTLPDGFKTIAIANSGSSTTTFGTATNASLVAETLTDTATIDTGNRWLTLVADADNDKVTLSHAKAGTASVSKNLQTNNNTSPNFGASFKVLTAGIDQAGHVKDLSDYTITLPKSSLAEGTTTTTGATGASVVTGIVLENADTGKFTKTTANIGTLALTGYELGTDAGTLASSDTINGAMSKLQKQISNEVVNRENAIKALDVTAITTGADKVFNSISETDGKVSASTQAVSNLTLSNYSISSSYTGIKSGNTLNTAFGQLEKGLAEEKARAQEEEQKLSDRITAIVGGVTEAELNTLKEISDALQDDENYYATVNNAIAGVQENLNKTDKNITDNYYTKTQVQTNYILKSEVENNYILRAEIERDYVTLSQYNALLERVKALEDIVFPPTEDPETI